MKVKNIIKFIILVGICYALLAFNIFHLGEKIAPNTKDYLETNIPTEDTDIENTYLELDEVMQTGEHGASSNTKNLEALCKTLNICNKIQFNGKFSDTERYTYTKFISKIIEFIAKNGKEDRDIKQVISSIEVNKDRGNRRGYATWDTIVFNIWSVQSNKEFIELTTHEMGHIVDLGYIQWSSSKKDKNYTEFGKIVFKIDDFSLSFYQISRESETVRKSWAKKKDFCSGYGMSDPFEDFSECFNMYINHNIFFREIAKKNPLLKKKYNLLASIFNNQYLWSNGTDLEKIKTDISRRPRDTTKFSN
jgi:hypothetical protein